MLCSGINLFSDPIIADGIVYFGSFEGYSGPLFFGDTSGGLHAVDAQSGQKLWDFSAPGILRVPAVADGTVYFGSDKGILYAVK